MQLEWVERRGHPSWRMAVQFADWDRPAVNGNAFAMFLCVWSDGSKPDPLEIVVRDGGESLGRVSRLHDSAEVLATLAPGHEGRAVFCHLALNRLVLREEGALAVEVADRAGVRHHLGDIRFEANRTGECVEPRDVGLAPILVKSLGRSGSTVLANSLGLHPAILNVGGYPFEYRFFSWCLHAAWVLTSPANHGHSMGGDAFESRHELDIGFNPFNHRDYDSLAGHDGLRDFYEGAFAERTAGFLMAQARDALLLQAARKPGATAFVEKMDGTHLCNLAENLCAGTKEIVLQRGLRDMVLSMIAFDAKRGTTGFFSVSGRDEADAWLADLAFRHGHLAERARLPGKIPVAYEDLVRDPRARMSTLMEELGMAADGAALQAMLDAFGANAYADRHSTAAQREAIDLAGMFSRDAMRAAGLA